MPCDTTCRGQSSVGAIVRVIVKVCAAFAIAPLLAACDGRSDAASPSSPFAREASAPATGRIAVAQTVTASGSPLAPGDELLQMKADIVALRREVDDLHRRLAHRNGVAQSETERADDPRRDPLARLEAERVERMRVASTESDFRGERDDRTWSPSAVANVRAVLDQTGDTALLQVRSIECRSQTCRLEVGADANGALERALPLISSRLAQSLPRMTAAKIDQGNGGEATVLYFSK